MASSRSTGSTGRGRRFPITVPQHETMNLSGAIAELTVCNILLSRGWYVFRGMVSSSPYDLIVDVAGTLFRVEVKSVRATAAGELTYTSKNAIDRGKFDILAQVIGATGNVVFDPPLAEIEAIAGVRAERK